MEELIKKEIKKVEKELREQLSQLGQEMNERFTFVNKRLDRIEGLTNKPKKSAENSIGNREALIERFEKGTLTADDVLYIMDNLENGERLDLLSKLYDLHYNFNPNHPKISEIEWED